MRTEQEAKAQKPETEKATTLVEGHARTGSRKKKISCRSPCRRVQMERQRMRRPSNATSNEGEWGFFEILSS